jgi:hypothetical protein
MSTDNLNDPLAALYALANGRAVISAQETATAVNRSVETLNDWIGRGQFPRWIQQAPGAPREQLVSVVAAHLMRARRRRYVPPSPRGALKRGETLKRLKQREGR